MSNEVNWADIEQVAANLSTHWDSVYHWTYDEGLPAHRSGQICRIKLSEADARGVAAGGEGESKRPTERRGRNNRKGAGR